MYEALLKLLFDLGGINNALVDFGLIKGELNTLFNFFREKGLHILGDMLAVHTMPIGYSEEVGAAVLAQMRQYQETILVDLVWVLG